VERLCLHYLQQVLMSSVVLESFLLSNYLLMYLKKPNYQMSDFFSSATIQAAWQSFVKLAEIL